MKILGLGASLSLPKRKRLGKFFGVSSYVARGQKFLALGMDLEDVVQGLPVDGFSPTNKS